MAGKVAVENMDQRSDDAPCRHKVAFVSLEPGEGMGRGLHTEEPGKVRRTQAESCRQRGDSRRKGWTLIQCYQGEDETEK